MVEGVEMFWNLQCFPNGQQKPGEVRDGIKKGKKIRQDRNEVGRRGIILNVKEALLACCSALLTCYYICMYQGAVSVFLYPANMAACDRQFSFAIV